VAVLGDLINTVVGLVLGLLSGYYFERRSSRSSREHAAELERELESLRASIYTVGGVAEREREPVNPDPHPSLLRDLHLRARHTQGADGRANRSQLVSHFCAMGHRKHEVEQAVDKLCHDGQFVPDGKWLEVR